MSEHFSKVRIKDVAAQAGVSAASVSYVLSGRAGVAGSNGGVSANTAERIRSVAATMGYTPHRAAQSIRTGRSGTILLSLTVLADPWALAVSDAVRQAAAQHALNPMIVADQDWSAVLRGSDADAAFIDDAGPGQLAELQALARSGKRLVVFDDELEPDGFDVIRSRARSGCELVIDQLFARHERVAMLNRRRPSQPGEWTRAAPYRERAAAAGLGADLEGSFTGLFAEAYDQAERLLTSKQPPTAIYATSDYAAISAVHAAQRLGMDVGVDVEVIGVGNSPETALMTPSVSSVGPVDFFTTLADFLVLRALGGETAPQLIDFPWTLTLRESSGLPRGREKKISTAPTHYEEQH